MKASHELQGFRMVFLYNDLEATVSLIELTPLIISAITLGFLLPFRGIMESSIAKMQTSSPLFYISLTSRSSSSVIISKVRLQMLDYIFVFAATFPQSQGIELMNLFLWTTFMLFFFIFPFCISYHFFLPYHVPCSWYHMVFGEMSLWDLIGRLFIDLSHGFPFLGWVDNIYLEENWKRIQCQAIHFIVYNNGSGTWTVERDGNGPPLPLGPKKKLPPQTQTCS